MTTTRRFFLCLLCAVIPAAAAAQTFGAAFGGWATTGARPADDPARGFRLSGTYDRPLGTAARWRIEGAFVQAGFTRDFPDKPNRHVTENSLELGAHLVTSPVGGGVRAFVGPVLGVGIGCGTDGSNDPNGRIACDASGSGNDGTMKAGIALGLHGEWGAARQFTLDLRAQSNTIASARGSGPAIGLSIGLRFPH